MTIFRLCIGGGALLLSMVGLLVCIAGVLVVWMLKSRIDVVGRALFGAADEAFDFVDAKLALVNQLLQKSRQRIRRITRVAERLMDARADARKEIEPLLPILDEVSQQLNSAESWLDSCHAVARGVSKVSEAVVSSEYAVTHQESTAIALAQRVQGLSEAVAPTLAALEVLRQEIVQLRDTGRLAREVAVRIVAYVADLDGKLANISERLEQFEAKVAQTKASCVALRRRVHWRSVVVVVVITVLLAWFAISQIGMMDHSWRLMQEKRTDTNAANQ